MTNWPEVAIIVLNWNGWRDTIECLESIQHLTYPNYQTIVVDNGSTNDSVERIKAWARGELLIESKFLEYAPALKPVSWVEYDRIEVEAGGAASEKAKLLHLPANRRLVLVQAEENLGFAEGCNVGIRYALSTGAQYVLLWNNDAITIDPSAIEKVINTAELAASIGIIGVKICYYDESKIIWYGGGRLSRIGMGVGYVFFGKDRLDDGSFDSPGPVGFVTGCFMFIKREVLESVGLFDSRLFFGAEDADFCLRAVKRGYQLYYSPQVVIYHKSGRTYDKYDPNMLYHMYSGKILFMKKHLPPQQWWLWRAMFLCYMLLIGIPKLAIFSRRSTGCARFRPIARSVLKAFQEHAMGIE